MIDGVVIVIGGGGHARVLIAALREIDARIEGIVEADEGRHGGALDGVAILGSDQVVLARGRDGLVLVNGVGSVRQPVTRRKVFERFTADGFDFATLIHPSAVIAGTIEAGTGAQIMAGAVIQPGARIGANTIINTGATVDHDCVIGDHVHLSPGVTLSGNVTVGHTSHVGAGATIIQGVHVGAGSLVAAGAVVVGDVLDNTTVAGIPARTI